MKKSIALLALVVASLTGCAGIGRSMDYPWFSTQLIEVDGETYFVEVHPTESRLLISWMDIESGSAGYNYMGRPLSLAAAKQFLTTYTDATCTVGTTTRYSASWEVTYTCVELINEPTQQWTDM